MTAIKPGDVDRAVRSRPPGINLLLFYGPDAGRVAERARDAARAAVDDPEDAFGLVRLSGDALADEPGRLVEEATTFGLFGGRRAIWVRAASRNIAPAVSACLAVPLTDTLVVIEGGDLSKAAPLRVACERSPRAYALPCYADEARDLPSIITDTLRGLGLAIEADARALLADSLGGDRLATRSELEKLALYCHGAGTVTVADVEANVSDVSGPSIDAALDAAFGGDAAELDAALVRLAQGGTSASAILPLALRHALALLAARLRLDGGEGADTVVRTWRGLNFRRHPAVSRQLRAWSTDAARSAADRIGAAILAGRQSAAMADAAAARCLFAIASRPASAGARRSA